jgi:hypothetical protein
MDKKTRDFWMDFANQELEKTADDDEQYSFLIRTAGSIDLMYCPYETTAEWDFDGYIGGLKLPWSPDRINQILNENATLTEAELLQWQRAKCQDLAKGSDWCCFAWIVPLRANDEVKAWALFLCPSQEELSPYLDGVFPTSGEALMALKAIGAVPRTKQPNIL